MKHKNVFLFPAFVLRYSGNEVDVLEKNGISLNDKLSLISQVCQIDVTSFNIDNNNFLNEELKNQLMTYVFSCSYSDILRNKDIQSHTVAGLSMGLYAAMYSASVISFSDGVLLIKRVFDVLKQITGSNEFSMLNIVGLSKQDILQILKENHLNCEVVIQNGEVSFIVSGYTSEINRLKELATFEGALYTSLFPVSIPYHSSHIMEFRNYEVDLLHGIEINKAQCKIMSAVTGTYLQDEKSMYNEIVKNLITPINWQNVFESLNAENETVFYECGPGNSMQKISKFLNGDFSVMNPASESNVKC